MKKKNVFALSALLCALLSGCKLDEPMSLKIALVGDTHAHFEEQAVQIGLPDVNGTLTPTYVYAGGYPKLKTKIDQLRSKAIDEKKGFLLLHSGDAFSGTLYFTVFKGQLDADFMNYFQFDAMAIGNHEFDLGNQALADFAKSLNFPLISANVQVKHKDPLEGRYLSATYKMIGDQPIVIVGLTTEFTEIISNPSDQTKFNNAIETARKVVRDISAVGVNKIIFLTHLGLDQDRLLAKSVPGIDVILGGHSHSLEGDFSNIGLPNYGPVPVIENDPDGHPVCIIHSGEFAKNIAVTDVEFSGNGLVKSCAGQDVLLVANVFARGTPVRPVDAASQQAITNFISAAKDIEIVASDATSQTMLDAAKAKVTKFASDVIGTATEPLYHVRKPGDIHPVGGVLENGSLVGPHVAQSMAFKLHQTTGLPYVAMMNAGGVRADLIGQVTIGSAYSVVPYASTLVTMTVTGSSLAATLSKNVSNAYKISSVAFPYVANILYTLNLIDAANPVVENIKVKDANGVFQPIDPAASYSLVTTSYLAGGGDLYSFAGATNKIDTGHVDAAALVEYIQSLPGATLNKIDSGITINK